MNRYLLVFIFSIFFANAFAQLPDHRKPHQKTHLKEPRKKVIHDNVPAIPGWVHIKELDTDFIHYVKPTEITLLDWTYFMLDRYKTEKIGNGSYQLIIPEKNEINLKYFYSIPELEGLWNAEKSIDALTPESVKQILVKRNVDKIPVTGISYQAASEYMIYVAISYKGTTSSGIHNAFDPKYDISKYQMVVTFMTSEEYKILLSHYYKLDVDSTTYKEHMNRGYDNNFCPMFNAFMPDEVTNGNCPDIKPTAPLVINYGRIGRAVYPVGSYPADIHGLYDLRGNVAEMTKNETVAMGGGYRTRADGCTAEAAQAYSQPATWLGFRPVIQIKKTH